MEKFESMRKSVTDGPTEGAEAEGVEKGFGLISDSGSAVLEIFVVKAQSGIDPDGVDTCLDSTIDFAAEVVEQSSRMIGGVNEIPYGTDIFPLDIAEDDPGPVSGDGAVQIVGWPRTGEIEDGGTCFEAATRDFGLIGFNGDEGALLSEGLKNRKKSGDLLGGIDAGGMVERGFCAQIDEVGALGTKAASAGESGVGTSDHAFAVPGVGTEVDDSHEMGTVGGVKGVTSDLELSHFRWQSGGVVLGELG